MGHIIKEVEVRRISRAFYDSDYRKMEKEAFKGKEWASYEESPYAEYKRRLKRYETQNKNHTGDH